MSKAQEATPAPVKMCIAEIRFWGLTVRKRTLFVGIAENSGTVRFFLTIKGKHDA